MSGFDPLHGGSNPSPGTIDFIRLGCRDYATIIKLCSTTSRVYKLQKYKVSMGYDKNDYLVLTEPCLRCNIAVPYNVILDCWFGRHTGDHLGLCCDCYDEKLGMPKESRLRPFYEKDKNWRCLK